MLATRPDIVAILRDEAEQVINEEGMTKAAMQKMRKLDSFLREMARLKSIGVGTLGACPL